MSIPLQVTYLVHLWHLKLLDYHQELIIHTLLISGWVIFYISKLLEHSWLLALLLHKLLHHLLPLHYLLLWVVLKVCLTQVYHLWKVSDFYSLNNVVNLQCMTLVYCVLWVHACHWINKYLVTTESFPQVFFIIK